MEAGKGNEKQGNGEGSFPLLRIRVFKTFPAVARVRPAKPSGRRRGCSAGPWANCSVTLFTPSSSTICGISQLSCAQQRGSGAGKTLLLGTGSGKVPCPQASHACVDSSAISCLLGPTA